MTPNFSGPDRERAEWRQHLELQQTPRGRQGRDDQLQRSQQVLPDVSHHVVLQSESFLCLHAPQSRSPRTVRDCVQTPRTVQVSVMKCFGSLFTDHYCELEFGLSLGVYAA